MKRSELAFACAGSLLAHLSTSAGATPNGAEGSLRSAPCAYDLKAEITSRVQCYKLVVPRRYDDPSRGTYELAVAVKKSEAPVPGRDPVLWVHGGPGQGLSAGIVNADFPFFPGADIVFFASRGARNSEPQPCTDLEPKKVKAFVGQKGWRQRIAEFEGIHIECRKRLDQLGIRTDEFGTRLNTEDLEQLRRALKVDKWNIWTGSWGSVSTSDYLAAYPQHVRATVIISPVPLKKGGEGLMDYRRYIAKLSEYCRADQRCRTEVQDLTRSSERARASLAEQQITVKPFQGEFAQEPFWLNHENYDLVLDLLMNATPDVPKIPQFVQAVLARDEISITALLRPMMAGIARGSIFGRTAPSCVDRAYLQGTSMYRPGGSIIFAMGCKSWTKPGLGARVPLKNRVPVLIMAGELDNLTPPDVGEEVRKLFGARAQLVTMRGQSHMPYITNECARNIVHSYFEQPEKAVDATCSRISPLEFTFGSQAGN